MDIELLSVIALFLFGFIGAFINSIVGGGGLITLPALLFVGLPPATAIATNKLAASLGNFTSMMTFLRAGKIDVKMLGPIVPFVFIGSMLGAFTVHHVDSEILRPLVLILLIAVLIYTSIKKDFGKVKDVGKVIGKKKLAGLLLLIGLGFYDGFFGPGTGSFMIFVLLFMGFNFIEASGSSKLLNFTSNLAALIMFLFLGAVNFTYGFIMGFAMILGAYVGSKIALSKGTEFIRVLFIIVTTILILKNGYDYFFS
ncbi:TSUP family transporter [Lysinibacillus odysseyi]|uniref:Probable membrane transporter protein n=1 Tax=Lysinibacillus odysseyi 34hs-1 = NBRC 100172 TaxID=1220589 RepID=A0A0A3J3H3_9BACI|nr:TSUP family transporter [Lysinibacillus odysseyi]KGR81597.1 membrane protein [Lysinibacillus odysseyi 34hs-1 = NBRC 100172]